MRLPPSIVFGRCCKRIEAVVGSVRQVLRIMARGGAFAVSIILAACSTPTEHASLPTSQVAQAVDAAPQLPDQSADEKRTTDHAHQAYVSCLNRAAHYADDHLQSTATSPALSPRCATPNSRNTRSPQRSACPARYVAGRTPWRSANRLSLPSWRFSRSGAKRLYPLVSK